MPDSSDGSAALKVIPPFLQPPGPSAPVSVPAPTGAPRLTLVPAPAPPAAETPEAIDAEVQRLEKLLAEQFDELKALRARSQREAKQDYGSFWFLKSWVFLGTLGPTLLHQSGQAEWLPLIGGLATLFAAVDAIRPKGTLFRVHRMAESELEILLETSQTAWEIAKVNAHQGGSDALRAKVTEILLHVLQRKEEILRSVATTEAVLGNLKNQPPQR